MPRLRRVGLHQQLEHRARQAEHRQVLALDRPETAEHRHQWRHRSRVTSSERGPHDTGQVAHLRPYGVHHGHLVGGEQPRQQVARQPDGPRPQPAADLVGPAGGGELLESVLAHRLQQPVAHVVALAHHHERLVHELGDRGQGVAAEHGVGTLQREAVGEHRQRPQRRPFLLVEQVPAPVDHRLQRLVPLRRRAVSPGQQREAVLEPAGDLRHGHDPHLRGGELDRERQAVEPGDQLRDLGSVEPDVTAGRGGPLPEQQGCVGVVELRQQVHLLGRDAERRAGGGQHAGGLGRRRQEGDQRRDLVDQVLAVVQDQQRRRPGQVLRDPRAQVRRHPRLAPPGHRVAHAER